MTDTDILNNPGQKGRVMDFTKMGQTCQCSWTLRSRGACLDLLVFGVLCLQKFKENYTKLQQKISIPIFEKDSVADIIIIGLRCSLSRKILNNVLQ
jgi:hypothetical protein